MSSEMREVEVLLNKWLVRYNELIQMDRTNEAEQVLRCINEGKRALLARTEAGACRSDDERAAVEFYALNPSAVKISDEMIERARLAYAAAIPGMFVNRTDDEPMFVEAWRAALTAALGDMVLVPRESTDAMQAKEAK